MNDALRRAIEEIKLRVPIEDVVRERVGGLRRAGALWVACCPFHEERTPSFKVDPRRGTWNCYGACSEGGDQISFVQQMDGVGFRDALEILAARAGVELPSRSGRATDSERDEPQYKALERARDFYVKKLAAPEGEAAREYLAGRGLAAETLARFHIGFAPADGQALVRYAQHISAPAEAFIEAGLVRRTDTGRAYDFFRGRLVIPIADERGRTVGFGARRLSEDQGPKYINTSETALFKKSRLVYGLDRCIQATRRGGELVLVEGYTDVLAGHQVGFENIAAVLGTSTTSEHAGLLRRAGARRVYLVFDGDEAGRRAGLRALAGLLSLEIDLFVVTLEAGTDPCDLFLAHGSEGFRERLENASDWFDFVTAPLSGLVGLELSNAVDEVLSLLSRIKKPVHKESLVARLADGLSLSRESLIAQLALTPEERRARYARQQPSGPESGSSSESGAGAEYTATDDHGTIRPQGKSTDRERTEGGPPEPPRRRRDPGLRRVFGGMVGAVLLDSSLLPLLRPVAAECPEEDISDVINAILDLEQREVATIDSSGVLTELADHGSRDLVMPLLAYAEQASNPRALIDDGLAYLKQRSRQTELDTLTARIRDLEIQGDDASSEIEKLYARLRELMIEKTSTHSLHPEAALRGVSS